MFLSDISERISFWRKTDRIGPEVLWTYWRLFFPSTMRAFCQKKFHSFDKTAELRPGSLIICPSKISIGKRVVIRFGSVLAADPRIGEHGITVEDDVLLSPGVHLYVNDHAFEDAALPIMDQDHKASKAIVIKRGAWIGAQAIILAGVTVGENSVVGAGSVVTRDIPPHVVAVGNPARVLKDIGTKT